MGRTPTAIRNRSVIDLTAVKNHLRYTAYDDDFDTILTIYLEAAKEAADTYCQNPFTYQGQDQSIPWPVEVWILQTVAEWFHRPDKQTTEVKFMETMIRNTNDYDLFYLLLKPYRLDVGFGWF